MARSVAVSDESKKQANEFQSEAQGKRTNLLQELWGLMSHTKKWWLTPIIIVLLLLGLFFIVGTAAPFIYTFF